MKKYIRSVTWVICCILWLLSGAAGTSAPLQKRVLFIVSYHKGYTWSDTIADTAVDYLKGYAPFRIDTEVIYMDTKRNASEDFKQKAGLEAKKLIESWRPDVVICCDDNASKYVITPYFLNSDTPFVFCGLNDEPQKYGFPADNVTGIREMDLITPLYNHLKSYARGQRTGYLTTDKHTQRIMAEDCQKQLSRKFDKVYFAQDFTEWKEYFLKLQDEVDILFMIDVLILPDWDKKEAVRFIQENLRVPSGATSEFSREYVLLCVSKSANEHGTWAAQAALKILEGTKPQDIPIVINKKGEISLNLILAEKLDVVFSPSLLRSATAIIDKGGANSPGAKP
jgi:hypothetical protein